MGELIHAYHVDLLVISNGPAAGDIDRTGRFDRAITGKSLRWTLADRSGADAYASSGVADEEMRAYRDVFGLLRGWPSLCCSPHRPWQSRSDCV